MAAAFTYRKEIDGLRALAVLPVLFFHAGFEAFSGGFVGVDIFFVISGYLITSILISEMDAGKFSLITFYERRARRILPALCTVILVSGGVAYLIMLPDQWKNFLQSSIAVIFFISNIFFWLEDDYFAAISEEKPLLHSWSLAVEEQYYIFFPILLILLWRFGRNPIVYITAFLALISLVSAEWGSRHYPSANFYLLFGRAWEILSGSLAAFYMAQLTDKKISTRLNDILAWIGFILLALSIFLFDKDTPFPSLYALLPIGGTLLILLFSNEKGGIGRLLAQPLFVGVGLISYSLYLWHQPVFAFARLLIFEIDFLVKSALIIVSVILAIISYYLIEKPARFTWLKNTRPLTFFSKAALVPIFIIIFSATFLFFRMGPQNLATGQSYAALHTPWNYALPSTQPMGRLILYGDSHARQYAPVMERFANDNDQNFLLKAGPACISLPGLTNYYNGAVSAECINQWQSLYEDRKANDVIMIAHRWGPILSDVAGNVIGKIGEDPQASDAMVKGLKDLIDKYDRDQRFIIIGNVPAAYPSSKYMKYGYARCEQLINGDCKLSYARKDGELYAFNQRLNEVSQDYSNVTFIDPYDSFCEEETCYVGRDGDIYYSDDAHLTDVATKVFLQQESEKIRAILEVK